MLAGCGLLGCGGSLPAPPTPALDASKIGPHEGMAYALPGGQGYAEVVNEPIVEARGDAPPTSIVVYFLGSDAKTSSTQTPTDVKVIMNPGKPTTKTVTLKAEPKAGDPAGGSRFASEPGPYRITELRGELVATLGAGPIKISVVEGR
jgi:hypothetical protein